MVRARWIFLFSGLLAMKLSVAALDRQPLSEPVVRTTVETVSLRSASLDKLVLSATVSLTSTRSAILREVSFEGLRLNGLPFYASPINDQLVLKARRKVTPPHPLTLTIYLRDLDSVKPLRALVAEGKLLVTGIAYADVNIGPAAKLFLYPSHARVPVKIENSVELQWAPDAVARKAVLALLDSVQPRLDKAMGALQVTARYFSQWRRQLWDQYSPALVLAYATYQLRDTEGNSYSFDATAVGFRVAGKYVIVPKAVLEPWKFDPFIAASMKRNSRLKVADYDLWMWPANAQLRDDSKRLISVSAWRLSAQQLRLLPPTKDELTQMILPGERRQPTKVSVHRRDGVSALALVEIIDAAVRPMNPILSSSPLDSTSTSVAVFRFPESIDGKVARPDLVIVSGSSGASGLELDTMIDSSGWGSPVITRGGIVGVVASETSVVTIIDAEKALGVNGDQQQARAGGK
jgi:hypothetical protein